MIFLNLVLIIFFSFLLLKSADIVVIALRQLARTTHTGLFALSTFLIALSTSFPEFSVAVTSSLEGNPTLSLGNVIGANITNLSFVAGLAAFIKGTVGVRNAFVRKEIPAAFVAGVLPMLLLIDGNLSRVDGLILIAIYIFYMSNLFKDRLSQISEEFQKGRFYRFWREFEHSEVELGKEIGKLFLGIGLLLFSADQIVGNSRLLATELHTPLFVVGVILISLGTTLPELAFSFKVLGKGQPIMFFGNILGSIVTNATLIVGIASLISPIRVGAISDFLISTVAFVIIFGIFWLFIRSKQTLERWEAGVLLLLYTLFVIVILL